MPKINCSFCQETVEAPLWPEEKPLSWELMRDGVIICPSHEAGFDGELKVPTAKGGRT